MVLTKYSIQKILIVTVLVGQILLQGVMFPGIGLPIYLIVQTILTIVALYNWGLKSGLKISTNNKFAVAAILFVVNVFFVSVFSGNFIFDRFLLIITSFGFCLACYNVINTYTDRSWLVWCYIAIAFVSALVEILQVLNVGIGYDLWTMTHQGQHIEEAIASERYIGLSPTILHFGYLMSSAITILIFTKSSGRRVIFKVIALCVMLVALITNNTRSSIAVVAIVIVLWMFHTDQNKSITKFAGKLILSLIIIWGVIYYFNRVDTLVADRFLSNEGFDDRLSMLVTALNHIVRYPMGRGTYVLNPELITTFGDSSATYVLSTSAHNLLGNCGVSYGFIGLFLMLKMYLSCINKFLKGSSKTKSEIIGALLAMLGLAANAMLHNLYIFSGDLMSFVMFALIISNDKIITEEYKGIKQSNIG